jgi:hypothetical protein
VKLSKHQSRCDLCEKIFSGPLQEKEHLQKKPHLKKLLIYQTKLQCQSIEENPEKVRNPSLKYNLLMEWIIIFVMFFDLHASLI